MKTSTKCTIAALCAIAAVSMPLSTSNVFPRVSDTESLTAFAVQEKSSGECSGNTYYDDVEHCTFYYKIVDNEAVITGCKTNQNGKATVTLKIPKRLGGYDVTTVADGAFKGQDYIATVEFSGYNDVYYWDKYGGKFAAGICGGSALSKIGDSAFEGCKDLTTIYFGSNALTVGDYSFYGCEKLKWIRFIDNDGYYIYEHTYGDIGDYAFAGTGLSGVDISCSSIGESAFAGCQHFTGARVTADSIGNYAFEECPSLQTIVVTARTVGNRCFEKCATLKNVTIKADSIGSYCFSRSSNVRNAELDVAKIGAYAFSKCASLSNLKLINTKSIGQNAFEYCTELSVLDIPETVESIGDFAFYKDEKISTPQFFIRENGERFYIGRAAFNSSGVEYAVFCGDNIIVGDYSFFMSNIKAAVVEGNVRIDHNAFNKEQSAPGFAIYGNADSNSYADDYNIPYVKLEPGKGYEKIIEDNKRMFNGVRDLENKNGSCAGIATMQVRALRGDVDISSLLPAGESFIDVPRLAYKKQMPEYKAFTDAIVDLHSGQENYLHRDSIQNLDLYKIKGYSKLTEYGISVPSVLRISNHYHAVLLLGIYKLDTPAQFKDAYVDSSQTYDYRMITCENGYMFRINGEGHLQGVGFDKHTSGDTWIDVENTYMYIDSATGKCYEQRWDDKINVNEEEKSYSATTIDKLEIFPGPSVYFKEKVRQY